MRGWLRTYSIVENGGLARVLRGGSLRFSSTKGGSGGAGPSDSTGGAGSGTAGGGTGGARSDTGSGSSGPAKSNSLLAAALATTIGVGSFYAAKGIYQTDQRTASIDKVWNKPKYGSKKEFLEALPQLEAILGEDGVSTDEEDLKSHGYSDWSTYNIDTNPIAIVYPRSTEEVSEVAKICHHYKLPMIGFSGGSSLEGHFAAPYGGICVDFIHMNQILAVRPEDLDATVQPSVGWMALNEHIEKLGHNLFFAVDPGPTAKLGGMVATSCSGTNCVKYGPMRDHIINLTVVLADGTIIKTRRRPRKSSAGYNLNHLFCGSEGTLGLITEITVKLHVIPEQTSIGVVAFPTVHDATQTATDIIRAGIPVHAVEFMDGLQMECVNKAGYTARKWEEKPTLMFKFSGTKTYVKEQIQQAKEIAKKYSGIRFEFASDEEEKAKLWAARKEALWSVMAMGPANGKIYTTDVCVPMSKLADLVQHTAEDIEESKLYGACLGHCGDGNFHATIAYAEEDYAKVKKVAEKIVHNGLELEGTCTGEHGIGAGKVNYLVQELGTDAVNLMRTIKLSLDPNELLNPGKIFTKESVNPGSS